MMRQDERAGATSLYQICVRGYLDPEWSEWFDGMTITQAGDVTALTGAIVDQAALYGVLARVRNLGLMLLSVNSIEEKSDRSGS
jgi:hypothetical protein